MKMSRKYLSIADSQGSYCDICRGRGLSILADCCVRYETDMVDPPNHIRSGSWCMSCSSDAIAQLGGTDKDHRHQILRENSERINALKVELGSLIVECSVKSQKANSSKIDSERWAGKADAYRHVLRLIDPTFSRVGE